MHGGNFFRLVGIFFGLRLVVWRRIRLPNVRRLNFFKRVFKIKIFFAEVVKIAGGVLREVVAKKFFDNIKSFLGVSAIESRDKHSVNLLAALEIIFYPPKKFVDVFFGVPEESDKQIAVFRADKFRSERLQRKIHVVKSLVVFHCDFVNVEKKHPRQSNLNVFRDKRHVVEFKFLAVLRVGNKFFAVVGSQKFDEIFCQAVKTSELFKVIAFEVASRQQHLRYTFHDIDRHFLRTKARQPKHSLRGGVAQDGLEHFGIVEFLSEIFRGKFFGAFAVVYRKRFFPNVEIFFGKQCVERVEKFFRRDWFGRRNFICFASMNNFFLRKFFGRRQNQFVAEKSASEKIVAEIFAEFLACRKFFPDVRLFRRVDKFCVGRERGFQLFVLTLAGE